MSQTKAVRIFGRLLWVWDNSHDIVVARMVEAAANSTISAAQIDEWRVVASISDCALSLPVCTDAQRAALAEVLIRARAAIEVHGDVVESDLASWSVLPDVNVSDGFLRVERLPVAALLDVVTAFAELVAGTLAPDPPGAAWFVGTPGGRRTIEMQRP